MTHLITHGTYLVSVENRLDRKSGSCVAREIARLLLEGAREIVVDFVGVTAADADGIAALVDAGRRAARAGTTVTVACEDPDVRGTLELALVGRFVRLERTLTVAFAGVAVRRAVPVPVAA
jgi:anti-anti-sigma regulatory factor